jgi:thiol-disulfide isomerase/thioredoxin
MTTSKVFELTFGWICAGTIFVLSCVAQQPPTERSASEMLQEIDGYVLQQKRMLASDGKRFNAYEEERIANGRKALAKKYAGELAMRTDLKEGDIYVLGLMYSYFDKGPKVLETMQRFLAQYPNTAQGDMVQAALTYVIRIASGTKQMEVAEQAFERWLKGDPLVEKHRPGLQEALAVGFFKAGMYEKAIKHAQEGFDLLKAAEAKTVREKLEREQGYMNLVEVLSLGYKKNKNADKSTSVLAEARAQSFAIPSANLYRKVMEFVDSGGFSEKKLMEKVESYASADPAPEIEMIEWIGSEPVMLEELRGKVILLDFWATWCGPCISTFPRLRDWHKKYSGSDFMIVGVTRYYGTQGGKKMTKLQELEFLTEFKKEYKMPYPIAIAGASEAQLKYGIAAFPTTVLLDRNGVVRYMGIGSGAEESDNLERMIKKVMNEGPKLASMQ